MIEQRIALAIQKPGDKPNKKNMGDEFLEILKAGGLTSKSVTRVDFARTNITGLYLWSKKNGDIAEAVGRKETLLGVVGEDKLGEYYSPNSLIVATQLGFSRCVLKFGVTERREFGECNDREYREPRDLIDKIIATNYPRGTSRWLDQKGIPWVIANGIEAPSGVAKIIKVDGGAESVVNWGSAQACVEVSETGTSMVANKIVPIEDVLESQAVLIANPILRDQEWAQPIVSQTLRRIMMGLWNTRFTMLEINYPKAREELVLAGLPARESPTKSALEDPNWGAAKVLLPIADADKWVEELFTRGARDAVLEKIERVYPNVDDPDIIKMMKSIYGDNWQPPTPFYSTQSLATA